MQVELTLKEIEEIRQQVVAGIVEELGKVTSEDFRKYAYTAKEVAKLISYHHHTVLLFIRSGKHDRHGILRHLPAKEITPGQYRILPHELENWLSHF